jgi:putative membrane protein
MEKGNLEDVKRFGHHMMEDHAKWNEDLAELARKKGIAIPSQPDEAQKKALAELAKLSGADFDKKYSGMMVADHAKAVALFEDKAKKAKDADIRAWAEKTVPKLQEHLKMARDLSAKLVQPD